MLDFKKTGIENKLLSDSTKVKLFKSQNGIYKIYKDALLKGNKSIVKLNQRAIKRNIIPHSESQNASMEHVEYQDFKSMISDYGTSTQKGSSPSHPAKPNQDSYIQRCNLIINQFEHPLETDIDQIHMFGVFDGHGSDGHNVSAYLK
jgi:hypothetical protein